MIRYLRHREIDKKKWNACIEASVNRIIYGFSWYLDITGPGWDALVGDDYTTVFPLIHNKKSGILYLYQPYFTQQLGVFSSQLLTGELVTQFLNAIPEKFRYAEIHLNTMNIPVPGDFKVTARVNHELDLIKSYDILRDGYAENAGRNLKKALNHHLVLKKNVEPDELITLFRENFGKKEDKLKFEQYDMLRRLLETCMKKTFSSITGILDDHGRLCAAAFLLEYRDRVIFHFAASDPGARKTGAMFFLVDHYIREHAGQALTLDFEGSNDANVSRFYKGFGARECRYPMITADRLPPLIRKGVNFVKKLRG